MLRNDHTDVNRVKTKRYLNLGDNFAFCKSFQKVTKNVGFHLMLKTANLLDITYTSKADDINVTLKNLYLFKPKLLPTVETELMFDEATQNNYKVSYVEY